MCERSHWPLAILALLTQAWGLTQLGLTRFGSIHIQGMQCLVNGFGLEMRPVSIHQVVAWQQQLLS